jgi:hypothetical protein
MVSGSTNRKQNCCLHYHGNMSEYYWLSYDLIAVVESCADSVFQYGKEGQ